MQDQLLFLIGSPRSGSTMFQRMLGSHSQIFTHPEPHLITPLAHLGYFHNVDKAPYDHINAAKATREFVEGLPHKEQDYLDACRAYADTLYGRMLSTTDRRLFLDKTPAYALVTDFLTRLYPNAHYIALTRHPLAILSSYAHSFFDGDYEAAWRFNPILDRYVPAIATFLRDQSTPKLHVRYEALVQDPEAGLAAVFAFLGLENEPAAANYGQHKHIKKSFGDPNVESHQRPVTDSVDKWAQELAADRKKLDWVRGVISGLNPDDLLTWGYPADTLLDPVKAAGAGAAPTTERINSYRLQRKLLLTLRRDIHQNQLGRAVKAVRYYCDVLLRES
jgi:hypothetical protein